VVMAVFQDSEQSKDEMAGEAAAAGYSTR